MKRGKNFSNLQALFETHPIEIFWYPGPNMIRKWLDEILSLNIFLIKILLKIGYKKAHKRGKTLSGNLARAFFGIDICFSN